MSYYTQKFKEIVYPFWFGQLELLTSLKLISYQLVNPKVYDKLKYNKKFIIDAITLDRTNNVLEYINDLYINDKEVAEAAVKVRAESLIYFSQKIKTDKNIVTQAVKHYSSSYQYCSLKEDKDLAISLLSQGYDISPYLNAEFCRDKSVALAAITNQRKAIPIQYFSENLRDDKEIVLLAVRQNSKALEYCSTRLSNDKEIVLYALRHGNQDSADYIGQELVEEIGSHNPRDYLEKYALTDKLNNELPLPRKKSKQVKI